MDEKFIEDSLRRKNSIVGLITNVVTAIANSSLYSSEHFQVKRHIEKAYANILNVLEGHKEITFMIIDEDLIVESSPLSNGVYALKFIERLQRRGIGRLTFISGITMEELKNFVVALSSPLTVGAEVVSSPHIKLGRVDVRIRQGGGEETAEIVSNISEEEMYKIMEIYYSIKKHRRLSVAGIDEIVTDFIDAFHRNISPLLSLAPVKSFDNYTFTHSANVCILTVSQAMHLGLEGQILHDMGIAALLHDVGKMFIPEEILTKRDRLDEREWEIMKTHPLKGAIYLMDSPGIPRLSVLVAFEHHMKYNFSGYPRVKSGWRQNLCSQITMITDFFDAMRTFRKYREPIETEDILAMIKDKAGTDFNPHLVDSFAKMMSSFSTS